MIEQIRQQITSRIAVYRTLAQKTHNTDEDTAQRIVDGELETFMNRLQLYLTDPKNRDATITIAQGANIFLEVIQSGLSFSQIANHVYISRLKGTGAAVGYQVTADGLIYQAQRAGAIDHTSEPVIVQAGESFAVINNEIGKHIAQHTMRFDGKPKFSMDQFLAGYVYVVYPNGDRELHWIGAERMKELRAKSASPAMYNDESFIQTKIIKHALRKVRKTSFLQQHLADDEDAIQQNMMHEEPAAPVAPPPVPAYAPPAYNPPPPPVQQNVWGTPPPVQQFNNPF